METRVGSGNLHKIRNFMLAFAGLALAPALPLLVFGSPWAHSAISPIDEVMSTRFYRQPRQISYTEERRLKSFADKAPIDCPAQDARTAVLVVAGQSNAAN